MRIFEIGYPVSQCFINSVLESSAACFDRMDSRAKQLHTVDIGLLALHVHLSHVDFGLQSKQGA